METASQPIIELRNLVLAHSDHAGRIEPGQLVIRRQDRVAIMSDDILAGRSLLRVLATLDHPAGGEYRFQGTRIDLESYQRCLSVKRQIGYVAADAAMISNRTLRENLLLTRFFYENDLHVELDETVHRLCADAGLTHKLDQRPAVLSEAERLHAIAIREVAKSPSVLLIELPELFLELKQNDGLYQHLKDMVRSGMAVVFISNNSKLVGLANRHLVLAGGAIRTIVA